METVKKNLYYILVGVVSMITLVFLPMIGSEIGLDFEIPNTTAGWIVFVGSKLIVATINIIILFCFNQQGKLNVIKSDNYVRAINIMAELAMIKEEKEIKPRSPSEFNLSVYGKKAIGLFVSSILSCFALSQAVLSFDYLALIVYLFVIIMGIIFGVISMKSSEEYWENEFLLYAISKKKEIENEQNTIES